MTETTALFKKSLSVCLFWLHAERRILVSFENRQDFQTDCCSASETPSLALKRPPDCSLSSHHIVPLHLSCSTARRRVFPSLSPTDPARVSAWRGERRRAESTCSGRMHLHYIISHSDTALRHQQSWALPPSSSVPSREARDSYLCRLIDSLSLPGASLYPSPSDSADYCSHLFISCRPRRVRSKNSRSKTRRWLFPKLSCTSYSLLEASANARCCVPTRSPPSPEPR